MSSLPADPDVFAEMALLARGFQLSKMIQVAGALELADRLSDGPRPAAALAAEAGAHPLMLLRLCRALAAFGIFDVAPDDQVSQTPRSECLRRDAARSLYHAVRYWTAPAPWAAWANLEHAVRTGESAFESVFEMPLFEYLNLHPELAERFNLMMQHGPDNRHTAVVQAYDFSTAGVVVDVGGGNGTLLATILEASPDTSGVLFDQAAVVDEARERLAQFGGRLRAEPGSFFDRVPSGGDVYTLSLILHDWNDERCLEILSNIRAAMVPGQRLLVIERLLEHGVERANPTTFLSDISMMVNLHGRERTPGEFADLFQRTGFGELQIIRTGAPVCILQTHSV